MNSFSFFFCFSSAYSSSVFSFCQFVGTVDMNRSEPCGELRMQWAMPGSEHKPERMPDRIRRNVRQNAR
jgi:hypothetical protein